MTKSNLWRAAVTGPACTVAEGIRNLDHTGLRIVLVCDANGVLLGTVTDGDIRRNLVAHSGLEQTLDKVMETNPVTALESDKVSFVRGIMRAREILHVPIVNEAGVLVGLHMLSELEPEEEWRDNPVFLMAGGFGKRLRPLTEDTPKPLLKVGSKPILETIIEQLVEYKFRNIFISTHYRAEQVRDLIGDGDRWGVDVQYIHEETPLGTAGSLGLLPEVPGNSPLLIMNGDLLTKVNFEFLLRYHEQHNGSATMCVREYESQVPYGVIDGTDNFVSSIVEKPVQKFFVNAGIYVLERRVLDRVDGDTFLDMPTLLSQCIETGDAVSMFPLHEYWLDIGQMEEYRRANVEYPKIFA